MDRSINGASVDGIGHGRGVSLKHATAIVKPAKARTIVTA
jgi:hypothetical protein